jgi:ribonuclease P protein component
MSRVHRLTGTGAFEALFTHGRRHEGRYVQLITVPAIEAVGRAGIVVGRKVLSRAVDRNRFKRLFREALRRARPEANALDLIVRVKRPLRREEIATAADEAEALLASCLPGRSTR